MRGRLVIASLPKAVLAALVRPTARGEPTADGQELLPLDPLVGRALALMQRRPRTAHRNADFVEAALFHEVVSASGSLDVGLWGRGVTRAAARAAARLYTVAVSGDDAA
jgi:hypothetical protein